MNSKYYFLIKRILI